MAQQDKTTYEGTFNNAVTGLYKTNTTKDIVSSRLRTHITNTKDSVPFTVDDSYTWPFPQVTASGTDTYAATLSPVITAYATGQKFQIKFNNASSGVSTLNLNALGAKKIYINPTTQATTGHIVAGQISLLVYDAALDTAAGGLLMIGTPSTGGGGASDWGDLGGTLSDQTDLQAALDAKQDADADLTAIAALTPSNDDVLQRKSGAWTNRTIAQLMADFGFERVASTITADVLTLDFLSRPFRSFDVTTTRTTNFSVAFDNETNLKESEVFLRLTGAIEIQFESAVVMDLFEESVGRWDSSTNTLTLTGTTASPFMLRLEPDSAGNIWLFATNRGV